MMGHTLEGQSLDSGGMLPPPEPEQHSHKKRNVVIASLAGAGIVAGGMLVALSGGGESPPERTDAGATETTADNLESTTTSTAEVEHQVSIRSLKDVMPELFGQQELLGLIGAQPGDQVTEDRAEEFDPPSTEAGYEGVVSRYSLALENSDPNLPTPSVGGVRLSVSDLAAVDEILTESAGPAPDDGYGPWGSIEREAVMWDEAERFIYADSDGREYEALALQGDLRIDAGGYSILIDMGRDDPANPNATLYGPLYENGAVNPHYSSAIDELVRATFYGDLTPNETTTTTSTITADTAADQAYTSTTIVNGHAYGTDSSGASWEIVDGPDIFVGGGE